jgi:hydroxyacylglutathione hydrolase
LWQYTLSNLAFAKSVEPGNQALAEKYEWSKSQLSKSLYTVPTTIGDELETNPFMRVNVPGLAKAAVGG